MSERDPRPRYADDDDDDESESEEYAIVPPNGGWGWVIVLSAFYCNLVLDGIQLTFGIFLQHIASDFNVESSKISLIGSLMFGIHLLVGPVCSGFSNVFGIRPVTAAGSLITATGLGLCYFSPNYQYLYFAYGGLGGLGLGLIYMNTLIITSIYFSSLRVLAVAIVVCGTGCGTVAFALLGNQLLKITTWQMAFVIEAGLAGSMFFAALTFKPLRPKKIIITQDVPSTLAARQSYASRVSRVSRMSRVSKISKYSKSSRRLSEGSVLSRRTTIYVARQAETSNRSLVSLHKEALNKIAKYAMVKQTAAQRMCPCCRACRGKQDVIYVHPSQMEELFEEIPNPFVEQTATGVSEGTITSKGGIIRPSSVKFEGKKKKRCSCYCNMAPFKQTMMEMLNFRLLGCYSFVMYCISGAFAMSSLLIVLMYEKDRAVILHKFSDDMATYMVVTLGAANMMWRLFLGGLSVGVKVRVTLGTIVLTMIGGAATFISCFFDNVYLQFAYCIVYSMGLAGFAVFRPITLIELIGTDRILNGTGISLLFMGVACIISPPVAGVLMEMTKNYNAIFFMAGSFLFVSALLLIKIHAINRKDRKRLPKLFS